MREKWLQKLGMDKSQAYVTVNIPLTAGNDTNMLLLGCCQLYLEVAARLVTSKLPFGIHLTFLCCLPTYLLLNFYT